MANNSKIDLLKTFIIVIMAIIMQMYFVSLIKISVWMPDFIVLTVIFIGYKYGSFTGTITGFILGIFQDSLGVNPIGMTSLAHTITGYLAGQAKEYRISSNTATLITIVLILLNGLIFFLLYQFESEASYFYLIFSRVFPNTIYTYLIGHVILLLFRETFEVFEK